MGVLPQLALFDGRDIEKLREEALRRRSPNRNLSYSKLSRTDSLCNSLTTRSDTSLCLDQSGSYCPLSDFDRRLRSLLKRRAFTRPSPGPGPGLSSKSREVAHSSLLTRKLRPNSDGAIIQRSESSEECKRLEDREPLTDAIMSLSLIGDSPPNAPTQTKSAPTPVVQNSLRNSIASFLSETIENGEDDDRSWIEDAHDYLNLLTNTPPKPAMETLSPSHSAVLSTGSVQGVDRDNTARLKVKPKQTAKKEVSSRIAFPAGKSAKAVVDRSKERALAMERRKRQLAVTLSLMEPTEGQVQRRKALGLSLGLSATTGGFESEESMSKRARRKGRPSFEGNLTADNSITMQADKRHGKWNARCRVPTYLYGYSKPFSRHREPSSPNNIPCYAEAVERMRRSFEVKPNRGTFSKTKRCSNAEQEPPHSHYAESRAIIAANRGIGMPFSGLGEEKDIRDGARWTKQGVRSSSVTSESRGRSKLTQSPRTVR
jgi:hypothetical protein